jgi:uncharacterized protein
MALTEAQFARAAALEVSQSRLARLAQMSYGSLRALLTGDPVAAAEWVRHAAEAGLPAAQVRFGRMLLEGCGVARDAAAALEWFHRAAARADAEAMNMVGRCRENGWGAPPDLPRAAASYRAAAAAGHDWGQYNLGNLLFDGRGLERDPRQALRWYLRAACQGHARAMNLAGRCLEQGWGCRRDPEAAAYWYRRSAESGYFRGQFNHAVLLIERGAPQLAVPWLWQAARGGNPDMRRAIAVVLARAAHPALAALRLRLSALATDPPAAAGPSAR